MASLPNWQSLPLTATSEYQIKQAISNSDKIGVPRYLFRGFSEKSGGSRRLNTADGGIIPRAFLDGSHPTPIYKQSLQDIEQALEIHICQRAGPPLTQFSSWAASIAVALTWAYLHHTQYRAENAAIAVLDIRDIPHNRIHFVPTIVSAARANVRKYDDEFLIHGNIPAGVIKVVSWEKLVGHGLLTGYPRLAQEQHLKWRAERIFGNTFSQLSESELRGIMNVGACFRSNLALPVTIALITLRNRLGDADTNNELFQRLLIELRPLRAPQWHSSQTWLSDSNIHTEGLREIADWIFVLEHFLAFRHGKIAKRKQPSCQLSQIPDSNVFDLSDIKPKIPNPGEGWWPTLPKASSPPQPAGQGTPTAPAPNKQGTTLLGGFQQFVEGAYHGIVG